MAIIAPLLTALRQGSDIDALKNKLKGVNTDRQISAGLSESVANARMMVADPRLAGQQLMEDRLAANTASAVGQVGNIAGSSSEGLDAITKVNANQNNAYNDIGLQAAGNVQQNRMNLQNNLQQLGSEQQLNFDQNVTGKVQALAALEDARTQNFASMENGITDLALSAVNPSAGIGKTVGTKVLAPKLDYSRPSNLNLSTFNKK